MGIIGKLTFFLFAAGAVFLAVKLNGCIQNLPVPVVDEPYWGPGKSKVDNTAIEKFNIQIDEKVLIDLKQRLDNVRLVDSLEGSQQHYGMNTELLKEIIEFWKNKYDWRQREKFLNKFPQYKTQIQGLNIHYIHVKPQAKKDVTVIPLLLLHGWPGSVREFYEIIPMLTTPQANKKFVFEVIIPSLPGYGFSQAAAKPGLGAVEMAVLFKNLMKRIGFEKFYVQGGDWGALITANMATLFPERVLGIHSNMCYVDSPLANIKYFLGSLYPSLIVNEKFEKKMYPVKSRLYTFLLEFGYMHLQATKPDTVGVGLNNSPAGLAAYILEKFTTWTYPEWKSRMDGGLTLRYKYENLLDNVMIYWVTNSITTSMRLYAETFNVKQLSMNMARVPLTVPSACARFQHELAYQSDYILKDKYVNLVQSSDLEKGGHFAAFEVPDILSKDIWSAIEKMRQ